MTNVHLAPGSSVGASPITPVSRFGPLGQRRHIATLEPTRERSNQSDGGTR
jgi:hypothetical protein